ncbi:MULTISPECIES: hypothetical protein [unclassified Flavobacterium]|uniref:hypothetical protein n=1 Tax=unclassified Flavobacterium TaxID=196869 RepID=UPI0009649577|nr:MULTISPECIES: hypothetical protein [unclassified Flavobacterium]MBN9284870.1 hypothetical protein [Flavobacterium sp.]OJV71369.1 MAG: hypothetical protein BGO42_08105 [Flavobacterium sp. 40-81]
MMKKGVLTERKNNILLFFILIIFFGCSCYDKQNFTIETINRLSSTHTINNSLIKNILYQIDTNKVAFDDSADIIVLHIEKIKKKDYKLSLTKTEFAFFKKYKSDYYFKTLKGYTDYENKKVLLYGDIDANLFQKTDETFVDFMKYPVLKNKSETPIIYEPTFIDFTINNNKLIE